MARRRNIKIKAIRREPPDLPKLSRAIIALAQAEAEKQAEAQHKDERPKEAS